MATVTFDTIDVLSAGTPLGGTETLVMFQGSLPAVTTTPPAIGTFLGVLKNNVGATADPVVGNDSSQGYAVGSVWFRSDTADLFVARSVSVGAAVWTKYAVSDEPTYIASQWYRAPGTNSASGVVTQGNGNVMAYPVLIKARLTISSLACNVTTAAASKNIQLALYKNKVGGMQPGVLVGATASISQGTTGVKTQALSGGNVQVEPGMYWLCSNTDNSSALCLGVSCGTALGALRGSATAANLLPSSGDIGGIKATQTFGTWPDLSSASFSDVTASGITPELIFEVVSVP